MNRNAGLNFILMLLLVSLCLTGCGESAKDREKMFKVLKKEEIIDVGDWKWDDYTEIEKVSNAPIPGYQTIYIYETEDATYRITYDKYKDMESDETIYRAKCTILKEDTDPTVKNYYFENRGFWGGFRLKE